jgi:hypothetical protein
MQQLSSGRIAMACMVLLACLGTARLASAQSAWDGMRPSPVWGDVQWGLVKLYPKTQAMQGMDKSDTFWKLEGGMRVWRGWLVGVGYQRIDLNSFEHLSQVYGTVLFNPGRGPWLFQAGVGQARYSYDGGFFEEKLKGLAVNLGGGYDWTPASVDDVHFGVRVTWEYSRLGPAEAFAPGSFNHSRLSFGLSASFY